MAASGTLAESEFHGRCSEGDGTGAGGSRVESVRPPTLSKASADSSRTIAATIGTPASQAGMSRLPEPLPSRSREFPGRLPELGEGGIVVGMLAPLSPAWIACQSPLSPGRIGPDAR